MKAMYIGIFSLFSTAAYATDARVAAFQGNRGLTDDTDYRTYFSRTNNGRDSMWFELAASEPPADPSAVDEVLVGPPEVGPQGGVLSAAHRADGQAMRIQQNTLGSSDLSYSRAQGDQGLGALIRITNFDDENGLMMVGGGYGWTKGDSDTVLYGTHSFGGDELDEVRFDFTGAIESRTLTKSTVRAYRAELGMVAKNAIVDAEYDMGWRFKSDRSVAAVTLGPRAYIVKPKDGDASVTTRLVNGNIAGEFALNDWFGLRGSVVAGLDTSLPVGDQKFTYETAAVEAAFGASLDFEGADIDFTINPTKVLDGPYFLTGAGAGQPFAASMSARFDI